MYRSNFRECFYYIVRHWMQIVIIIIIGSVLSAGYTGFKTYRNWDNMQADVNLSNEIYNTAWDSRNELEQAYRLRIQEDEELIGNLTYILENTPEYNYDPETIGKSSVILKFDFGNKEDGSAMPIPTGFLKMVRVFLKYNISWERISQITGVSEEYVESFVNYWQDDNTKFIHIVCIAENPIKSDNALDYIIALINTNKRTYLSDFGDFQISYMNRLDLEAETTEYNKFVKSLNNKINKLIADRDDAEMQIATLPIPELPLVMPTTGKVVKSIIKHFIFGAALGGVFAVVMFYVLFYINGRLHSEDEFKFYAEGFSYTYEPGARKKKFKALDKFIAKCETRGLLYSQDEAISRAITNIKTSKEEISKVMITGTISKEEMESLNKTIAAVKTEGLTFGVEPNILYSKDSFNNLKKYDAVIIAGKIDKSSIALINREIEQIKISDKNVIGCLLSR